MGTEIDKLWLPVGHHWDLHIEHSHEGTRDAGAFTGGGWKLEVHITVSPWGALHEMVKVLKAKHAEPHLVLGGAPGRIHPALVQLLPFDRAGRALQNDSSDGYDTNRANVIQLEICANPGRALGPAGGGSNLFMLDDFTLTHLALSNHDGATDDLCMTAPADYLETHAISSPVEGARAFHDGVASWTDETYKALGNVFALIRHRVPIPNKVPRAFTNTKRFTDAEYVKVAGAVGHMHTPDNDHVDPTPAFKGTRLVHFTSTAPNQL